MDNIYQHKQYREINIERISEMTLDREKGLMRYSTLTTHNLEND